MKLNFLILALAAIVPMVTGFIWYHPKVMGTVWMKANDITQEKLEGANMGLILFVTYIFSFFIAMALNGMVIHQTHLYSILLAEPGFSDPNSEISKLIADFMSKYGNNFRTFKHGALHGSLIGLFFAMPLVGTGALFERKGFKYIAVHAGYWIISLCLMGGIICQFA
jgi:Protein of unknown function (DUF1761)